jgi:hypothetical protein
LTPTLRVGRWGYLGTCLLQNVLPNQIIQCSWKSHSKLQYKLRFYVVWSRQPDLHRHFWRKQLLSRPRLQARPPARPPANRHPPRSIPAGQDYVFFRAARDAENIYSAAASSPSSSSCLPVSSGRGCSWRNYYRLCRPRLRGRTRLAARADWRRWRRWHMMMPSYREKAGNKDN